MSHDPHNFTDDLPPQVRRYWRIFAALLPVLAPSVYALAEFGAGRLTLKVAIIGGVVGSFSALTALAQRNPFRRRPPEDGGNLPPTALIILLWLTISALASAGAGASP